MEKIIDDFMLLPNGLKELASLKDDFGFLESTNNWLSHLPLMLISLKLTKGTVVEYGSGASSEYLSKYCDKEKRQFLSYDNSPSWCNATGATYIENWAKADIWRPCSVALVDHAPGEDRHLAVIRLKGKAEIIVCHDTELNGAGDYKFEPVFKEFKYVLHYNRTGGGAGATALSDTIDLTQFKGAKLGQHLFE